MGEKIEIVIRVQTMLVSDLHKTISSILSQDNLNTLDINVRFINSSSLNIQNEILRLKKNRIHVTDNPSDSRFILSIISGDAISRSFLYKGCHFLLNNQSLFVCPEYSFRRIDNTLVIATIKNEHTLFNHDLVYLMDCKKLNSYNTMSPRADIIKDTCSALKTLNVDFLKYVHQLKTKKPFFDSIIYSPQKVIKSDAPIIFQNNKHLKTIKQKTISLIKSSTGRSKILKKILESGKKDNSLPIRYKDPPYISTQMRNELEYISNINYGLKGYMSMQFIDLTFEAFSKSEHLFSIYSAIAENLKSSSYEYIMVLPWLISGGIDLFAINYLNTIAKIYPSQNILVILTNEAHRSFTKEQLHLAHNITILDLPRILKLNKTSHEPLVELLYSLINTLQPQRLHIIASKVGYDCVIKYGDVIRSNNTKILFSSYNYLTGPHGEYMGYSVQELPQAYRPGDIITTDNSVSKEIWVKHYGFIDEDILVHHQLYDEVNITFPSPTNKDGINILWAAHVRPEKNPEILPSIAESLQSDKVNIDCYGLFTPQNWADEDNPLETNIQNLHYNGAYKDFFKDINLAKYDLFLYTSHTDGTPNVIIEAALAGLPIVASKIGGIPETLGENATLVEDTYSSSEFIQAIRTVLSNIQSSRKKAKKLQQELTSRHSKENFTNQVKDMLKRSKL